MPEDEKIQTPMRQEDSQPQQPNADQPPHIPRAVQAQQAIETPQSVAGGDPSQPDQEKSQHAKLNRYERWALLVNGQLVIVTAVYAYFAWGQWNTLEATLKVASEQTALTRETVRARIVMSHQSRISDIAPHMPISFTFYFTNTGGSTALNVGLDAHWQLCEGSPRASCLQIPPFPFQGAIGPGETASVGTTGAGQQGFFTIRLTAQSPEDMQALREERKTIYLYGTVQYSDILSTWHTTEFCRFYYINTDSFAYCPTHNYAD